MIAGMKTERGSAPLTGQIETVTGTETETGNVIGTKLGTETVAETGIMAGTTNVWHAVMAQTKMIH